MLSPSRKTCVDGGIIRSGDDSKSGQGVPDTGSRIVDTQTENRIHLDNNLLYNLVDQDAADCLSGSGHTDPHPISYVKLIADKVRVRRRRWAECIRTYLTETDYAVKPPFWRAHVAQLMARCGDTEQAIEIIQQAYEDDRSLTDAFSRVAGLRMQEGYWREAEELMRRDLRLNRMTWPWKLKYAEALAEIGHLDAAQQLVDSIYAHVPDALDGHVLIGRMYARRNDWPRVYACTEKDFNANRLSPRGAILHAQAATCCGDHDRALELIARAYQADATITDAHIQAAWEAFWLDRRYAPIIEWAERDHETNRLTPAWQLRLSQAYAAAGHRPKACQLLADAQDHARDHLTCYERMAAHTGADNGTGAINDLQAMATNPAEQALIEALRREPAFNNTTPKVIIFGAGSSGIRGYKALNGWYEVVGFCDNNESRHGERVLELPVIAPEALASAPHDRIVVCSMYEEEIVRQLIDGLKVAPSRVETFGIPFSQQLLQTVANAVTDPEVRLDFSRKVINLLLSFVCSYEHIKLNPYALNVISRYVDRHLSQTERPAPGTHTGKRRVLICCDRIKAGFHDTHALIYSAIGAQVAKAGDAEVHIIATHENQIIPDAEYEHPSRSPLNEQWVNTLIRRFIPDQYGHNVFVRYFDEVGLDGLAGLCDAILALQPDAVLYASGRLFWNECPLVRHSLFGYVPTGFFFVQCGDRVDEANDVIIARSNHTLIGRVGSATVMVQPYPIITKLMSPTERADARKGRLASDQHIMVSGLAGKRMEAVLGSMNDACMKSLLRILDDGDTAVWHFIGALDTAAVERAHPLIEQYVRRGKIRVSPLLSTDAFESAIAEATLFLHPPGFTGGGRGAHIARRYGIPVLCFNDSDPAGLQPPMTIFQEDDIGAFADAALRLMQDRSEYLAVVEAQDRLISDICDTGGQGFCDCIETAIACFQKRKANHEP